MNKLKIFLLLSYICIASLSAAIITPALPQIQSSFQLSHGALEWIVSLFLLGYVIGQLLYGPLANRYNPLNALRLGLCINLIGIIGCILAVKFSSYGLLLLGRLVTALGAASGLACTFMLIHELLNEEQAKHALAYSIVTFTVGIGLAVTLGGIVAEYWTWQACFYLLLGHGILMLALSFIFPTPKHQAKAIKLSTLLHDYKIALQSKTLVCYALIIGFCSVFGYTYSAAAPIIAHDLLHLSPSAYGYWNLINMVGMCASGFLTRILLKAYEPRHLLKFALIACLCSLIILVWMYTAQHISLLGFFLLTSSLYLFSGMLFPCASYYATKAIDCKASASSMMSFINMGSAMLAVIFMGYLPTNAWLGFIITLVIFYGLALFAFWATANRQQNLK